MAGTEITETESAEFARVYDKVGRLKRVAIDAYMVGPRSWSWTGMAETWRIDSEYSYQGDSPLGDVKLPIAGSAPRCSRPDPDGNGGGVVKQDGKVLPAQSEAEMFDMIRRRIDDALEDWRFIPLCSRIADVAREFGTVRNNLIIDQAYVSDQTLAEDGLDIGGVGEMKGVFELIGGIVNDMDFMSGGTAHNFKELFLAQIGATVTNLGMVARSMVLAMAVQHGLWKGVHEDIERLVDACIDQCNEIVKDHTPQWQVQLRVLQTAYNVAAGFFPVGRFLSTAAEVGFSLADELVDTPGKGDTLRTYDDVLQKLESALEALNDEVERVEKDLRDNLAGNLLDAMRTESRLSYYFGDAEVAWSSDEIGDPDVIRWPDGRVISDLVGYLNSVADDLDGEGEGLGISTWCRRQDPHITISVARSQGIGLTQWGPGEALQDLNAALSRALDDLAWKIRGGADNLTAAYEWHLNTDDAAKASLDAIAQRIEGGSGITVVPENTDTTPPMCVAPQPDGTAGVSGGASHDDDPWSSFTVPIPSPVGRAPSTEETGPLRF